MANVVCIFEVTNIAGGGNTLDGAEAFLRSLIGMGVDGKAIVTFKDATVDKLPGKTEFVVATRAVRQWLTNQ